MRRKAKRRNLYHCSVHDHGETLVAQKQQPWIMSPKEPVVPRLCVCPTVPQCFAARLFENSDVYVYKTLKPTKGVTPFSVWDELITDERWLLPGHKLERIDYVTQAVVTSIFDDVVRWHLKTGNNSDYRVRVAMLWRACVSLPKWSTKRLDNLVHVWCETLELDPLEMFSE